MARNKKNSDEAALLGFIVLMIVVSWQWIENNIIGIIGIFIMLIALYIKLIKKRLSYNGFWVVFAIGLFISVGWFSSQKKDERNENLEQVQNNSPKEEITTEDIETKEADIISNNDLSIEEKIEAIVVNRLRTKTNTDQKILDGVTSITEEDGKTVSIVLHASDNLTSSMIKKGMLIDSTNILEPISKLDGYEKLAIFWFLPLTDTYGNQENSIVMSFTIDKNTLNKINWDNFLHNNLQNVVNNYFEHATLQD